MPESAEAAKARRLAAKVGYRVIKSRERRVHQYNRGMYCLLDDRNTIVIGANFSATPAEVFDVLKRIALN
jgi:hypothetical protein